MHARIAEIITQSVETKQRFFQYHTAQVIGAAQMIAETFNAGGKVMLCGNGGSAADAQHIAGEFVNRFLVNRRALPAMALNTDGGVLSCIANDTDFKQVYARQIEAFGRSADVLIVLSTSGTSANIVAALEAAKHARVKTIGLLGRDGGRCAELCTLALIVESADTPRIQETHNLIGHILCELVERQLFPERFGESAQLLSK